MENHSVIIRNKLYEDLKDYCKLNNLKLCDLVNDLLQQQFTILKYGESPFKVNDDIVQETEDIKEPPKKVVKIEKVVETPKIEEVIKEIEEEKQIEEVKPKKVIRLN